MAAALGNRVRPKRRLLLTAEAREKLAGEGVGADQLGKAETVDRAALDDAFGAEAVHQGCALQTDPLPGLALETLLDQIADRPDARLVCLDQVSDPQNVGAIIRSAAAFSAAGVIVTDRNAPPETPAMAKAASGALERMPLVRVGNLSRAMETLKDKGFWIVGLDGEADMTLYDLKPEGRLVLVLGAEGRGLRRLVAETCDLRARLPISDAVESLNVSNAAAVALYELGRGR